MSDNVQNPYPVRRCDPRESGVLAHYTFGDGELAQFGRYLNRHADYGAAYDLTTRVGTPGIGLAGGLYVPDQAGSYWQGVAIPGVALTAEARFDFAPAATRVWEWNGTNAGTGHALAIVPGGTISGTMNGFGTSSIIPYSIVSRGPFRVDLWHDGVLQRFLINGRLADSDAGALGVPAGLHRPGYHGEISRIKIHAVSLGGDSAYRASYVSEFARELIGSWRPERVGEGPAGGIPTGAVGEGDWFCPLGAATMQFVWRPASATLRTARLALANIAAPGVARLAFTHPRGPAFGSWLFSYQIVNPAVDFPYFSIANDRTVNPAAPAAGAYNVSCVLVAGQWQVRLSVDDGGSILLLNHAPPVAGDVCQVLVTRAVSGDWRIFSSVNGVWYGSEAATVNNVTYLASNYLVVMPRNSYVLGMNRYQGEMLPNELPAMAW